MKSKINLTVYHIRYVDDSAVFCFGLRCSSHKTESALMLFNERNSFDHKVLCCDIMLTCFFFCWYKITVLNHQHALFGKIRWTSNGQSRVTLYTAGHLHTAVPHCSHSRAPIVHTAVPRENNEHGCVYLRCTAVCKLPGCAEGHPWQCLMFQLRFDL